MNLQNAIDHVKAQLLESARVKSDGAANWAPVVARAAGAMTESLEHGGKVLLCGNGGSAADAQHLAAELVGRFVLERRPLPAIALTTDSSILTAVGNDYGFEDVFIRQVQAHGRTGDVLVGISTSGNSSNVLQAVQVARGLGMLTIGLSGRDGGRLAEQVDFPIVVNSSSTARIQECHIAIGHILCELVEAALFQPAVRPVTA